VREEEGRNMRRRRLRVGEGMCVWLETWSFRHLLGSNKRGRRTAL
jgi:hypothetical protein